MNFLDESISILFGILRVRSKIEVEVPHLALVSTISIQNNLDISCLWDSFCQQILTHRCSNGGNIEGFSYLNHIFYGFKALLSLIDELSVIWVDMFCHFTGINNIGTLLHSDGESLQGFSSLLQQRSGNTCHQTRI
jgi:hypothetical protein